MNELLNTPIETWKTRPIFISSTFRDMQAERDWLCQRVFPRIEEKLRKRKLHLEPIDLRLGIETAQAGTEEERELLVLKVCLNEIKRSRPFIIVLLGKSDSRIYRILDLISLMQKAANSVPKPSMEPPFALTSKMPLSSLESL